VDDEKIIRFWRDLYRINWYDAGADGLISLTALCRFMQESAWRHAKYMNLGFSYLAEDEVFWVLSRILIRVHSYPLWDSEIAVETWPTGVDRVFAMRDFHVSNTEGGDVCSASSAWLVLDIKTHRPRRIAPLIDEKFLVADRRALERKPDKISATNTGEPDNRRNVLYSDIDVHNHVNNVKYMEWIFDSLPIEHIERYKVDEIELNFVGESSYGGEVFLFNERVSSDNPEFVHTITGKNGKRVLCRAHSVWKKMKSGGAQAGA
jgi:medium-chain acyl-[acyl-carrier-protein] hydrolase